jgi:hypothetical protein
METNWLIVVQRSSLASDLHLISVEEVVAEEDHRVMDIGAEVAEDMEIDHHRGFMRAFVQEWIHEMTEIGVTRELKWWKFAFGGVCGFDWIPYCGFAMG